VFKNSGLLREVGDAHIRSSTRSAIRQAMRESFCPFACAACEVSVFHECADLKAGRWETLGKGVTPRCGCDRAHRVDADGRTAEGNGTTRQGVEALPPHS
jgi:hypothetical protein